MSKTLKPGTRITRDLLITRDGINVDARTVQVAFSSTAPVTRYWGTEILSHAPGAIRLDRIRSSGPLLLNHDTDAQIGVIESVQIGTDQVGRAVVRFGKGAEADAVFQDVVDDIRRNISVGYVVHAAQLTESGDSGDVYTITDWEPYEISIVPVPADISVGVGRSADNPVIDDTPAITEVRAMPEITPPAAPISAATDPAAITAAETRGAQSEQRRVADILALGEQFRRHGAYDMAVAAVRDNTPVDAFRTALMTKLSNQPQPTANIGMSDRETRQYSVVRALNALANPTDPSVREAAAFEFECSRAASDKQQRQVKGLLVPFDVLTRELNVGTPTAGGNTVATNLLAGDFISMLRNAMAIDRLGMRLLTGLVGNIAIPRMTGGGTAYWVAESGAPTVSQQAFDQVAMSPKTLAGRTSISRKLLLQSSIDVETMVRQDLATVIGLELQRAAINGSGTAPEPRGILNVAGIGAVVGGTNGLAPAWSHLVALETAVSVANADVGTLAYLSNTKVRGKLKSTQRFSSASDTTLWDDGDTPVNGYRCAITNAVPSNLTKGTSVGVCSAIIFGNFADLIMGMWGGLELQVDPYSSGDTGSVIVRAFQDSDIAVRHPESFAAMADALTA